MNEKIGNGAVIVAIAGMLFLPHWYAWIMVMGGTIVGWCALYVKLKKEQDASRD